MLRNTLTAPRMAAVAVKTRRISPTVCNRPIKKARIMDVEEEAWQNVVKDYVKEIIVQERLAKEDAEEDALFEKKKEAREALGFVLGTDALLQVALKEDVEYIHNANNSEPLKWTDVTVYSYKEYEESVLYDVPEYIRKYVDVYALIQDEYAADDILVVEWNKTALCWEEQTGGVDTADWSVTRILRMP